METVINNNTEEVIIAKIGADVRLLKFSADIQHENIDQYLRRVKTQQTTIPMLVLVERRSYFRWLRRRYYTLLRLISVR